MPHDGAEAAWLAGHDDAVHEGTPVVRGDEHHVVVVADEFPFIITTAVVVDHVRVLAGIDVADEAVDGHVVVELVEVHVRPIPSFGLVRGGESDFEGVQI